MSKRTALAKANLSALHYRNEKSMSFERYIEMMTKAFTTLEKDDDERYSERRKVEKLLKGINTGEGELQASKAVISQVYPTDFVGACAYFSQQVAAFMAAHRLRHVSIRNAGYLHTALATTVAVTVDPDVSQGLATEDAADEDTAGVEGLDMGEDIRPALTESMCPTRGATSVVTNGKHLGQMVDAPTLHRHGIALMAEALAAAEAVVMAIEDGRVRFDMRSVNAVQRHGADIGNNGHGQTNGSGGQQNGDRGGRNGKGFGRGAYGHDGR